MQGYARLCKGYAKAMQRNQLCMALKGSNLYGWLISMLKSESRLNYVIIEFTNILKFWIILIKTETPSVF